MIIIIIISKYAVVRYYQLLSKLTSINGKSSFDQLATASSPTPPKEDLTGIF